ncbi:cytochrome c oxidase subunit 2 [Alkalibacillus salilacus]|uniref:Cytochrome aa3 subunit 2 n=2 Tax=Alkalibacillus salilacus TaxID=284582 RepID=A0ABT9VBI0_9BACI|nr:cytochrome c oxidase subunit 2 [Alkalibacillus salilacus]
MHRYEKIWLTVSSVLIIGFTLIVGYQAFAMDLGPPSDMETIDPQKVDSTAPFDEPGITQIGDKEYEVVMTLQAFSFTPRDLEFPEGSTVHFIMTSKDVVHGMQIAGTNFNAMITPGHVTRMTQTFDEAGDFLVICNEFCGTGHEMMSTEINIR